MMTDERRMNVKQIERAKFVYLFDSCEEDANT